MDGSGRTWSWRGHCGRGSTWRWGRMRAGSSRAHSRAQSLPGSFCGVEINTAGPQRRPPEGGLAYEMTFLHPGEENRLSFKGRFLFLCSETMLKRREKQGHIPSSLTVEGLPESPTGARTAPSQVRGESPAPSARPDSPRVLRKCDKKRKRKEGGRQQRREEERKGRR